jgi:hypothetical protein
MMMLFANTFKSSYYKHLIGSSAQHFYDVMRIVERRKQKIQFSRIVELVEKIGFARKKIEYDVNNLEGGYKGKNKKYNSSQIPTSQIININFVKPFAPN